jgi:hypothetical protein
MSATHVLTMNGRISGELKDTHGPQDEEIRRRVRLLDGVDRYSLSLWAVPPGMPFDRLDLRNWPKEYIQCAGSAERMTVEIRRLIDGVGHQYVLGHPVTASAEPPEETIAWDGVQTTVRSNEIFNASEAADLFIHYFRTSDSPDSYGRRELAL